MEVLRVENLRKVFPGPKPLIAVDGISFSLKQGEILGLLGPNGAGKTTTIQMLLSTLTPSSGVISVFGKDLAKHRSEILQSVTFASTYVSLPWNLTVEQNLDVYGRLFSFSPKAFRKKQDLLLDRFGILGKKKSLISTLSSGQITRLMLVKAFMVNPKLVLLDEPTASLDPDVARDVIDFILEQNEQEGVSILFTSHNMAEVTEVCDRVLFLRKGKIYVDDLPENLAKKGGKNRIELVIPEGIDRALNLANTLAISAVVERRVLQLQIDDEAISKFLHTLAKEEIHYSQIEIVRPTLEDFFLRVAKEENLP